MHMKIVSITIFCFILANNIFAQQNDLPKNGTILIKGKVWPLIGFGVGVNCTLGLEYGFSKCHGLGIELDYTNQNYENELRDTINNKYYSGPRLYNVRRGVLIGYRYYLDIQRSRISSSFYKFTGGTKSLPYLSAFLKYTKYDQHYQQGFITNNLSYDEWHYSAGIVLGIIGEMVDVNIGSFYKLKFLSNEFIENNSTKIKSDVWPVFGIRVGVNVIIISNKKSNHLLNVRHQ